jgi:hypothetical protein
MLRKKLITENLKKMSKKYPKLGILTVFLIFSRYFTYSIRHIFTDKGPSFVNWYDLGLLTSLNLVLLFKINIWLILQYLKYNTAKNVAVQKFQTVMSGFPVIRSLQIFTAYLNCYFVSANQIWNELEFSAPMLC